VTGLRPWRCRKCDQRFFAWSVPLSYTFSAHCRLCGNFNLQRVSSEHVQEGFHRFWRWLHAPAYRCAPCRNRFFSILPQRQDVPVETETVPE
jgi:hypothetical protein